MPQITNLRSLGFCLRAIPVLWAAIPLSAFGAAPTIGGVRNLASFDSRLSPGVLAEIYGEFLPGAVTRVEVGGLVATRVNPERACCELDVQLPADLSQGPATVVLTENGVTSAPFQITLDAYAPGVFSNGQYDTTGSFVRTSGLVDGVALCRNTPASGEMIGITAIGLGPAYPDAGPQPAITVAGRSAELLATRTIGTGRYQIDFRVPPGTPAGFHPVVLSIGSKNSNPVYLPVGNTFYNLSAADMGGWPIYTHRPTAAESIVTARPCGGSLAKGLTSALGDPRNPPTILGGTTVKVRDSEGVERLAQLDFVSALQVNYIVPAGTALGNATVTITTGDGAVSTATVEIQTVAPGVFLLDSEFELPAAEVVRLRNGVQTVEQIYRVSGGVLPLPIDWGLDTDELFLTIYGTGMRHRSSLESVRLTIGCCTNIPVLPVAYVGPQGDFVGTDQVNVRLPRSLKGILVRSPGWLSITVDGKAVGIELFLPFN